MAKLREDQIDIVDHPVMDIKLAIVNVRGRVYACTYAPMDEPLTKRFVMQQWAEDRKSFRPFDTTTGRYLR